MINRPLSPGLSHWVVRTIAGLLPTYFILELFVFSLVWIFVEKKPLESYRRSLGTYLFALFELGLLFSVVFSLASCPEPFTSPLNLALDSFEAIAFLEVASVTPGYKCMAIGQIQRVLGALIVLIIVASLVGKVFREEED